MVGKNAAPKCIGTDLKKSTSSREKKKNLNHTAITDYLVGNLGTVLLKATKLCPTQI